MATDPNLPAVHVPEHRTPIRRWFDWLLPRRGWVFALSILWGLAGVFTFLGLKRDLFPDMSLPVLSVLIQSPGRATPELELSVAQPTEQALGGMPGVRRVNAVVLPELVQVVVTFEGDTDPWRARQLVAERLSGVVGAFPAGTRPPLMTSASGRLQELMEIVLEGEKVDPMRLRDHTDQVLAPRLQAVPGVARVERLGGQERSLQITLIPEKVRFLGVGLDRVMTALEQSNQDLAAGVLEIQDKGWFMTVGNLAATPEEVRQLPVQAAKGIVTLGEVAEIREAPAFRRGLARHDGHEDVSLRIVKQPTAATLDVAEGVRGAVAELRKGLPEGMRLETIYDQGRLVTGALDGVTLALLVGGVFVALVLVLLLGNARGATLVLAVLPLATFGAAIPLHFSGLGLNAMTLGGLAISVGLLVDASVIMVENLAHRLHEHRERVEPRRVALTRAAAEVSAPILIAVLVILAVFIPLLSMGGIAGKLYAPLAMAVASAMTISLVLTFTLVPALVERFLPPGSSLEEPRFVTALKGIYRPALEWALRHGPTVRVAALALTVPSIWLAFRLGTNFLPTLDERAFMLLSKVPAESSLEAVDQANVHLDARLKAIPGVQSVYRRSGRAEVTEDPCPITDSEVMVILAPGADERGVAREVLEAAEAMPFPVEVNTPMQERIAEGIGGTPADIQVKLFNRDLEAVRGAIPALRERLSGLEGVRSVTADTPDPMPRWRAVLDEEALRRLGVPRTLVARTLQAALQGLESEVRFDGPQRIERVVRFPNDGRVSPETLKDTPLVLEDGRALNLGQVVRFAEASTPTLVRRESAQRRIGLNIRTSGDLGGTARRIEKAMAGLRLPEGTSVQLGGKIEEARETQRRLGLAIAAALSLVMGLLYLALKRWKEVFVVVATLPDAFAGALFALWLAGETWNISSIVGMIGLFGVAVQNSLVLITQAKDLMAKGVPFQEALREASLGRVRPKLMTAGAAILGLMPMLFGFGGSELERPLAIAMVGGLVTSTLFTLLALPSFYAWVGRPKGEGVGGQR
ncbi:efflux RND transporter permease subunit [Mesoterricola silvestris]|uniref:Multidrug transporter AcrB n=1 Tax=Mesoterricola silvestris TaxID=2927979 RepID=A0AA48GLJ3_9BACT|nr:efflux RND transporter permease subunit [Mesoterricola silvestris]BDU72029.1 multidrug transporter AcrB [Mesoterricola silvestris]